MQKHLSSTNNGVIKSEWEKNETKLLMKIKIPFNTSAVIVIPSNVYELSKSHSLIKKENKCTYIEVGSGSYEIKCNLE